MGERDAFGNEVSDDRVAVPLARDLPARGGRAAAREVRRRRTGRAAVLIALAGAAVAVGVPLLLGVLGSPGTAPAPSAPAPTRIPGPLPAEAPRSAIRTADVERAITAVRDATGARDRPVLIAIGPGAATVDVQVRTPGGGLRGLTVTGGVARTTFDQGSAQAEQAYRWEDVDPRAPARLTRVLDGVSSLVLVRTQAVRWVVSASDGTWFAGPDGLEPRRP